MGPGSMCVSVAAHTPLTPYAWIGRQTPFLRGGGGVWALSLERWPRPRSTGIPRRVDLHTKRVAALSVDPCFLVVLSHAGVVSLSQDTIASAKRPLTRVMHRGFETQASFGRTLESAAFARLVLSERSVCSAAERLFLDLIYTRGPAEFKHI